MVACLSANVRCLLNALAHFSVLVNITDSRPKVRYLVAVDAAHNTLEEIVKAISDNLGTGRVDHVPKEEALVDKNLSVSNHCSVHVCVGGWVDILLHRSSSAAKHVRPLDGEPDHRSHLCEGEHAHQLGS